MEAKFKSLSIFEFQSRFSSPEKCYEYLADIKWSMGYKCVKCCHTHYCKGIKTYDRQCTRCHYLESPTSGTIFHKVKFCLLKAFWIVYYLSTSKKGISSTELSRKLQLRQKTCWLFRMKVLQAMASHTEIPLEGKVAIDECVLGQQDRLQKGKKNKAKQRVIIAIEKKGKGVSRICAQNIFKLDKKNILPFMMKNIDIGSDIKSDALSTYRAISGEIPNLHPEKSRKNSRSKHLSQRVIMSLTSWLRGTHGHAIHLQYYLNEYCYRFNDHLMKVGLFEKLIFTMVKHKPTPYKMIISYAPNSK